MKPISLCTYFDRAYLPKGLALLRSIRQHLPNYQIFVLALDDDTRLTLRRLFIADHRVQIVGLPAIESEALLAAKLRRSPKEYIWTLTAPWIEWLFETHGIEDLAYIDADCFLFADLAPIYAEVAAHSIGIIPHRWTPRHAERLRPNGIYNVGWVYFRNDPTGRHCLKHWRSQSLGWRGAPGTFSDQVFLDEWPLVYGDCLRVIAHIGANVAPWNQEQYRFTDGPAGPLLHDPAQDWIDGYGIGNSDPPLPVLFYHFHETRLSEQGISYRSGYALAENVGRIIYEPYERVVADEIRRTRPE